MLCFIFNIKNVLEILRDNIEDFIVFDFPVNKICLKVQIMCSCKSTLQEN